MAILKIDVVEGKYVYILIGLFLIYFNNLSVAKTNGQLEYSQPKNGVIMKNNLSRTTISQEEKIAFINAVKGVMLVLAGKSSIDDQKKYFGEFSPDYTKSGEPPNRYSFEIPNVLGVSFKRPTQEDDWDRADVMFMKKDLNNLETKFDKQDLLDNLQLVFQQKVEKVAKYGSKEMVYYAYTYQWKLDSKINILFLVHKNKMLKDDDFPSNFYSVMVYRK